MSVTAAKGFTAAGIAAGIKENGNPDLALVVNNGPRLSAAGVFTSNRVKAAPVLWSEQVLKSGELTAVVLNSGGANACTGPKGFQDTHATAEKVAESLNRAGLDETGGHAAGMIAVCSTGLIGVLLPMDKLLRGVDKAVAQLSPHGGEKAAIAIKTTDTVHKTSVVTKDGWTVGGMAKGAGMLAPGLATMLVVLTTDADLDSATLDRRCAPPPRSPSTGSTPTAACPPTTPCCCWPPAPAKSPRSTRSSRRPCDRSATTSASS